MSNLQYNMFGPPEAVEALPPERRLADDAPVPSEREMLWPSDLLTLLGADLLERLYGDLPRRTKLKVLEICRRLRCGDSHVYELIQAGSLDATNISHPKAETPYYRIYRYSLVRWLFIREFVLLQTRAALPPADLDRCLAAAEQLKRNMRRHVA